MTRQRMTADDVREMRDLRAEGCSNAEIVERTGWSYASVRNAIGKQPRANRRPYTRRKPLEAPRETPGLPRSREDNTDDQLTVITRNGAQATIYAAAGEVAILTRTAYLTMRIDDIGPTIVDLADILTAAAAVVRGRKNEVRNRG